MKKKNPQNKFYFSFLVFAVIRKSNFIEAQKQSFLCTCHAKKKLSFVPVMDMKVP